MLAPVLAPNFYNIRFLGFVKSENFVRMVRFVKVNKMKTMDDYGWWNMGTPWQAESSDDDLGWMFVDRLLQWEQLGLKCTDPCVVDHVDFWCEQGNEHVRINYMRHKKRPMLTEADMCMLLQHVSVVRWRKRGRFF